MEFLLYQQMVRNKIEFLFVLVVKMVVLLVMGGDGCRAWMTCVRGSAVPCFPAELLRVTAPWLQTVSTIFSTHRFLLAWKIRDYGECSCVSPLQFVEDQGE